jgi:Tfp pilus assembly protein PilX
MRRLCCAVRNCSGSVLIVCMVVLAALSMMAMTAIEVSVMGQKMIFAYAQHGDALRDAESQLIQTEREVWHQLNTLGLAATASYWSSAQASANASASAATFAELWTLTEFNTAQCGLLFTVNASPASASGSHALRLSSHWWVCCESRQDCEQASFLSRHRLWQRSTVPLN